MSVTIRAADETDAGAIAGIYAPIVEETHVSFETDPPSATEMAGRIRDATERFPWLVCEHEGAVVGYAYAGVHKERPAYRWSVDASVYVAEEHRRSGVARALYESLLSILHEQGFYTVYAVIALPNPSSVAFHESLGFERVALYEDAGYKRGDWHDVGHWERSIRSPRAEASPPSPPVPFETVRESDAFVDACAAGESLVRI